jgi:ribonuclease HI
MNFEAAILYTDGACSGNPGPGGWAMVLYTPDGHILERGGRAFETTNNKMEMTASLEGLKSIPPGIEHVLLFTDSTYVIRGITQWIFGWKKKGWINATGGEVANVDLWKSLEREVYFLKKRGVKVEWRYCPGHAGIEGNERVDEIAVSFSKGSSIDLYRGSVLKYEHDLISFATEPARPLPEMKDRAKTTSKAGVFYLSLVNGALKTHTKWAECEAEVKGRSGAKFKKVSSEAEATALKKTWGVL